MENAERSSHIFTLAEEAGISLGPGEQDALEDNAFLQFCEKYRTWSEVRDKALKKYLKHNHTQKFFRCYLPYSTRIFQIAYQVLWYLDEIVVRDPISLHLAHLEDKNYENTKINLRRTLQLLSHFRQSIESGYLLLAGSNLLPILGETPLTQVKEIATHPQVISELDQAVRFGLEKRKDDQGREWAVFNAQLDSGATLGWHVEKLKGSATSPAIRIGEVLPISSASEISKIVKEDVYNKIRDLYPREVYRTLKTVSLATSMNAAILFDRQVDSTIISIARGLMINRKRQELSVGSFNLALPYLRGVPADRLLSLREVIPEAFYEFRARMVEIVNSAMKEDPQNTMQLAQLTADRKLLPHISKLKTEMEAASRKARILGYGLPVLSTTGALIGASVGVDIVPLLILLMTGAAGAIKAAADFSAEQKKIQINPFYFLWRAKKR